VGRARPAWIREADLEMRLWSATLGALLCVIANRASADPVEPKVLLLLGDSPGWSQPSGIGELGLLLAIYEDGQVLLIDRKSNVPTSPHLSIARIDAGEAKQMTETYRRQLDGVPKELRGDGSFSDMGSTYIQVWDAERRQYHVYSAYGLPCLPPGEIEPHAVPETPITRPEDIDKVDWGAEFTNWTIRNRKGTDPRFIAACDALLAFSVADAKPWLPEELWVRVWQSDQKPDEVQSWPADWPPMPTSATKGKLVELCFRLAEPASAITVRMRSNSQEDRKQAAEVGFPADATHWWAIGEWGNALPGEIRIATDETYALELARGPCKTY